MTLALDRIRIFYRLQTKLLEGNVFTGVCLIHKGRYPWSFLRGGESPSAVEATSSVGTHPTGMFCCSLLLTKTGPNFGRSDNKLLYYLR